MRVSEAAAVITSFALLVVIHTVTVHWSAVTNGPRTLFGVPPWTGLGTALIVGSLAVVVAYGFKESRIGLMLRASRDDPVAAAALGVHIPRVRWLGFIVSALLAGVAGAVWAHFITSFSPAAFYLKETLVILGMLVIGGPLTVTGAVVGTVVVTLSFGESDQPGAGAAGDPGRVDGGSAGDRDDPDSDPAPRGHHGAARSGNRVDAGLEAGGFRIGESPCGTGFRVKAP